MRYVNDTYIPPHMRASVHDYLDHGLHPGQFLYHILCNDFVHAVCVADDINKNLLFEWANFLYWEIPSTTWGSKEKVDAYMKYISEKENEFAPCP